MAYPKAVFCFYEGDKRRDKLLKAAELIDEVCEELARNGNTVDFARCPSSHLVGQLQIAMSICIDNTGLGG